MTDDTLFDDASDDASNSEHRPQPGANIADGIYLSMSFADYLADRALSGSAFKTLLTDPAGLWWDSSDNPLYVEPSKAANRHRLRGSAAHCLILEGEEAYQRAYQLPPPGCLTSFEDCKEWMRRARATFEAQLGKKLGREEAKPFLLGDDKDELCARILALDPDAPIWTPAPGVEIMHESDDAFVRLAARFITNDAEYVPYFENGFSEVSIFVTIDGVRRKCRPDRLNAKGIVDLKTYGKPPRLGLDLKRHCVREAGFNGYDLQAVNNLDVLAEASNRLRAGTLKVHGDPERAKAYRAMVDAHEEEQDFGFRWLFTRMNGALTSIMLPFREGDQLDMARSDIEVATGIYQDMVAMCGDGIWSISAGVQEIDEGDFVPRMSSY